MPFPQNGFQHTVQFLILIITQPFMKDLLSFGSENRPSRSDLSILVAHNDDPTGIQIFLLLTVIHFD